MNGFMLVLIPMWEKIENNESTQIKFTLSSPDAVSLHALSLFEHLSSKLNIINVEPLIVC